MRRKSRLESTRVHNTCVAIPIPLGSYLQRVRVGCGGRIPFRATPSAFVLALWALDVAIADDEREAFDLAVRHWTLSAAFTCIGDVTRHIAMRPEIYASRGDANR
jgi:hypothetical protein